MHIDESLPTSPAPTSGSSAHPGIKLPVSAPAKGAATPGGVPPMFASPDARYPVSRSSALEH